MTEKDVNIKTGLEEVAEALEDFNYKMMQKALKNSISNLTGLLRKAGERGDHETLDKLGKELEILQAVWNSAKAEANVRTHREHLGREEEK